MSSEDGILVLSTGEKSWWWSMQEVIPAIERVWTEIGPSKGQNVHIFRAPLTPETELRLQVCAARSKRIIITAVTPGTVRIALFLRLQMKVSAPMIIYIFGDSTEGFHAFDALANALIESDKFVVSSEAEAVATRCSFPNADISVIPIPLVDQFNQFKLNGGERDKGPEAARFAYVGRISEQKNLHTLLLALWILRTSYDPVPRFTVDVIGAEDNLGSPNMGLKFPNYGTYLQGLAESLGVDHMVTWHGFRPRDWIFSNVHLAHHILVSPTLHSDENFGSSVLASLVNGHQVVTTAWGGHLGFQEWFPQQLMLVPVHRSTMGPVVDPVLLANAILRAVNTMSAVVVKDAALHRARAEFSESSVTTRTFEILNQPGRQPVPLKKSPTQLYLDERRALFGGTRMIYANYADPVAQIFFEAYGMKEPLVFQEQSSYVLPPWTSCTNDVLRVDDPHRGHQSFSLDAGSPEPLDVAICPSMDGCRLPKSLVKTLVTQGYAFSLPETSSA